MAVESLTIEPLVIQTRDLGQYQLSFSFTVSYTMSSEISCGSSLSVD